MNCEQAKDYLDEYITNELDEEKRTEVEQHLALCEDCKREYDELKALKADLSSLYVPLPEGYGDRLRERIKKQKVIKFASFGRYTAGIAAAVILVCVIVVGKNYSYTNKFDEQRNAAITADNLQGAAAENADEVQANAPENAISNSMADNSAKRAMGSDAAGKAENGMQSKEYSTDSEDMPLGKFVPEAAAALPCYDVEMSADPDKADKICDKLINMDKVDNVEYLNGEITFRVDGIAYDDFKNTAKALGITEKSAEIKGSETNFNVRIEIK